MLRSRTCLLLFFCSTPAASLNNSLLPEQVSTRVLSVHRRVMELTQATSEQAEHLATLLRQAVDAVDEGAID